MKIYHGNELIGSLFTNRSMTVYEALDLMGIDMDVYAQEHDWDDWDPEELRMED